MKILLDTHILIWYFSGDEQLSKDARDSIADESNEIYYSLISVLEIEIKHTAHPDRLSINGERFLKHCERLEFIEAPLSSKHVLEIKNLIRKENALSHRDPFDRIMLSQAIVEGMKFMTHDERIAEYVTDVVYKV